MIRQPASTHTASREINQVPAAASSTDVCALHDDVAPLDDDYELPLMSDLESPPPPPPRLRDDAASDLDCDLTAQRECNDKQRGTEDPHSHVPRKGESLSKHPYSDTATARGATRQPSHIASAHNTTASHSTSELKTASAMDTTVNVGAALARRWLKTPGGCKHAQQTELSCLSCSMPTALAADTVRHIP